MLPPSSRIYAWDEREAETMNKRDAINQTLACTFFKTSEYFITFNPFAYLVASKYLDIS